jgi:integrase
MRPRDIEQRRGVWVYRPASHKTAHKNNVRVIVLGPRAQAILAAWMKKTPSDGYLLQSSEGGVWTSSLYSQAIRKAAKAAGVPLWSPNQLRHACGTRVRRKFGLEAASAVLGHSVGRSRITDTYTHAAVERELILAASRAMKSIG